MGRRKRARLRYPMRINARAIPCASLRPHLVRGMRCAFAADMQIRRAKPHGGRRILAGYERGLERARGKRRRTRVRERERRHESFELFGGGGGGAHRLKCHWRKRAAGMFPPEESSYFVSDTIARARAHISRRCTIVSRYTIVYASESCSISSIYTVVVVLSCAKKPRLTVGETVD